MKISLSLTAIILDHDPTQACCAHVMVHVQLGDLIGFFAQHKENGFDELNQFEQIHQVGVLQCGDGLQIVRSIVDTVTLPELNHRRIGRQKLRGPQKNVFVRKLNCFY